MNSNVKGLLESKTLWINAISLLVIAIQGATGYFIDPNLQLGILGLINLILRFVTHTRVTIVVPDAPIHDRPQIPKRWWESREVWVSIVFILSSMFQMSTGIELSPEKQLAILPVVSMVLRMVTSRPISW